LINTLTVSNTTANSNGSAGTYLQAFGGQINNAQFSNYTGNSNTTYGFIAQATSAGVINNLGLNQTTTNNNLQQGLRFQADTNAGSQINALTISNAISNANLMGVYITTSGPGVINSTTLSNITANNNTQYGYFFNAVAGTMNNISLSSSNAVGNGIYGVYVNDDTTGPFLADLGGGTLGSIGQNRIYGNTSSDIRVDVDGGQLKAKNNWWGVNTGLAAGKVSYEDASTIDSTAFLTTDPRP
jgi:hypothetical protein